MGVNDLILELRQKGYELKADGGYLDISPADLPPDIVQTIRLSKAEILTELQRESRAELRRKKALALLDEQPETMRGIFTDTHSDPDSIIMAVAIRDVGTCELAIPRGKYDPWLLLGLIERLGQTTH